MGKTRGPYNPDYPIGTVVRVANRAELEQFCRNWKYHHPLEPKQIGFAGLEAKVTDVGFYHGGDELYTLEGITGLWHEGCIKQA